MFLLLQHRRPEEPFCLSERSHAATLVSNLFLKLQLYTRQLLKHSFADCLKSKIALPLCKYLFFQKHSVLMSCTPTEKCNLFFSVLCYAFSAFVWLKLPQGITSSYISHPNFFFPPNFTFFFSQMSKLTEK